MPSYGTLPLGERLAHGEGERRRRDCIVRVRSAVADRCANLLLRADEDALTVMVGEVLADLDRGEAVQVVGGRVLGLDAAEVDLAALVDADGVLRQLMERRQRLPQVGVEPAKGALGYL